MGSQIPLTKSEWIYSALWRLETDGIIKGLFANSRPLGRDEVALLVANAKWNIITGKVKASPFDEELVDKLEAEFASDLRQKGLALRGYISGEGYYLDERNSSSISLWGAASFHPASNLTLYEEIDVAKDKDVIGKEGKTASKRTQIWKLNYTADFKRAYISFRWSGLETILGRQSLFWGPGHGGSLVISDNSPAFDMVLLNAKFDSLKAFAFSAVLDKMWSEHGDPPRRYLANRYISGHRIDWLAHDRLELGLSEMVLYGGEARNMELYYINPLIPYYATQWNAGYDDNVMVCADFSLRPVDSYKIYGQLLVDDFSYSGGDPNALGYLAGIYSSDFLGLLGLEIRAEYTRINSYTYTHLETENQYTHYGWIIGHQLGPDADQLTLELCQILSVNTRVKLAYSYKREGSRTVADRFRGEDYGSLDFPSGDVEKRHKIGLGFLREPLSGLRIDLQCAGVIIRNGDDTDWQAEISLDTGFLSDIRR
jgi:hypothetical protein